MIRKSLFYGFIAAAAAVLLVFAGCSQATDSGESTAPAVTPDGLVIDAAVTNAADFKAALGNENVRVIVFDVTGGETLEASTEIFVEKTVYLTNSGTPNATVTPASGGLIVRGTLIVGRGVTLAAEETKPIKLWSGGSIQVQDNGTLSTDKRLSVNNRTDTAVTEYSSVLGKNVRFLAGSALEISDEALTLTQIGEMLDILTPGTLPTARMAGPTGASILIVNKTALKPSELVTVPQLSSSRILVATAGVNETAASFTVPAGAVIIAASGDIFGAVTDVTVEGALTASSAMGNQTDGFGFTVAAGGSLTTSGIVKLKPSTIAAGGIFTGQVVGFFDTNVTITADANAVINGYTLPIRSIINQKIGTGNQAADPVTTAITVAPENPLLVPPGSVLAYNGGITVSPAADFTVANGATVTIGGSNFKVDGSINVSGALTISGVTAAPITGVITVEEDGEFVIADGVTGGDLDGTIVIKEGAVLRDLKGTGGSLWADDGSSTGSFVFNVGAQGYVGSNALVGSTGSDPFQLTAGTFTLKADAYALDGNATVNGNQSPTKIVDIKTNSVLTIADNKQLTIRAGNSAFIAAGGQIVGGGTNSKIIVGAETTSGNDTIPAGVISGDGAKNFYSNSGALLTTIGAGTYNWNTDAGSASGNQPGWKAQ
jgi:hypothetical protein